MAAITGGSASISWKSSREGISAHRSRLVTASDEYTLVFPFRTLWHYGGFARAIPEGKLIGVIGRSGGMKTSFLETITDIWRQMDEIDILWWGTEWNWQEMADRAIQRYGGCTTTEMRLHTMWLQEEAKGIDPKRRHGIRLSAAQREANEAAAAKIEKWLGLSWQLSEPVNSLKAMLDLSANQIEALGKAGRQVRVEAWDYAQLMEYPGAASESERMTNILAELKKFGEHTHSVGLVASQMTKSGSSMMKQFASNVDIESAQNTRSDKFNLGLILKPVFNGQMMTNKGILHVAKNNAGSTGETEVYIDPAHLAWIDKLGETK